MSNLDDCGFNIGTLSSQKAYTSFPLRFGLILRVIGCFFHPVTYKKCDY